MKNIVRFEINKRLDFKNHSIGIKYRKKFLKGSQFFNYYKKLAKAKNEKKKWEIFNKETARFYDKKRKFYRDLIVRQTQELWNNVELKYISTLEKIHQKKFPYKRIFGILSTAGRFGYNTDNKWFACPYDSPVRAVDTAMHEMMHFIFHKYFFNAWQKRFSLTYNQIWTIKEAVTVILNSECNQIRFNADMGHPGHENLREKIKKDWPKYKDFEIVLNRACEHVKNNKLFMK
jgi:hypothetical protein